MKVGRPPSNAQESQRESTVSTGSRSVSPLSDIVQSSQSNLFAPQQSASVKKPLFEASHLNGVRASTTPLTEISSTVKYSQNLQEAADAAIANNKELAQNNFLNGLGGLLSAISIPVLKSDIAESKLRSNLIGSRDINQDFTLHLSKCIQNITNLLQKIDGKIAELDSEIKNDKSETTAEGFNKKIDLLREDIGQIISYVQNIIQMIFVAKCAVIVVQHKVNEMDGFDSTKANYESVCSKATNANICNYTDDFMQGEGKNYFKWVQSDDVIEWLNLLAAHMKGHGINGKYTTSIDKLLKILDTANSDVIQKINLITFQETYEKKLNKLQKGIDEKGYRYSTSRALTIVTNSSGDFTGSTKPLAADKLRREQFKDEYHTKLMKSVNEAPPTLRNRPITRAVVLAILLDTDSRSKFIKEFSVSRKTIADGRVKFTYECNSAMSKKSFEEESSDNNEDLNLLQVFFELKSGKYVLRSMPLSDDAFTQLNEALKKLYIAYFYQTVVDECVAKFRGLANVNLEMENVKAYTELLPDWQGVSTVEMHTSASIYLERIYNVKGLQEFYIELEKNTKDTEGSLTGQFYGFERVPLNKSERKELENDFALWLKDPQNTLLMVEKNLLKFLLSKSYPTDVAKPLNSNVNVVEGVKTYTKLLLKMTMSETSIRLERICNVEGLQEFYIELEKNTKDTKGSLTGQFYGFDRRPLDHERQELADDFAVWLNDPRNTAPMAEKNLFNFLRSKSTAIQIKAFYRNQFAMIEEFSTQRLASLAGVPDSKRLSVIGIKVTNIVIHELSVQLVRQKIEEIKLAQTADTPIAIRIAALYELAHLYESIGNITEKDNCLEEIRNLSRIG